MSSVMKPKVCQRFLRQSSRILFRDPTKFNCHRCASSSVSASTAPKLDDPGKLVSGLTREEVDANPEIAEFLRINFEEDNQASNGTVSNGIQIPDEILKEFGVTKDDMAFQEASKKRYGDPRIDAGLGIDEQQKLNIRVLRTYLRTEEGTKPCNRLRNHHRMIPGILYGGVPTQGIWSLAKSSKTLLKTPWAELQRELDRFHRRFESRVYDLTVYENKDDTEGTVHRVVPRNVQRHPVEGKIYCANFVRYHPKRPLKIPLVYINKEESPALKRDGFIVPVQKHVECFIEEGVPIPDALEVECTGLVLKDVIRMDRVIFPEGVSATDRVDIENFVVGPVQGGRSAAMADDDEEGEAQTAEGE